MAGIVGTLELGRASGDYEWYGAGIGGLLVIQGLVGAWAFGVRRPSAA